MLLFSHNCAVFVHPYIVVYGYTEMYGPKEQRT